jgi:hypothetical protein
MLLKRMLDDSGSFGPGAAAILLEAYDGLLVELDLGEPEKRVKAVKVIVDLARRQTDLDPATLRAALPMQLLNERSKVRDRAPEVGNDHRSRVQVGMGKRIVGQDRQGLRTIPCKVAKRNSL